MAEHRPLLGRLAARWFNEVIATDALRLLLDDQSLRTAFLGLIADLSGVDLSPVTAFERERPTADGRLDLEGVDPQGRPRLIIEAKFGHTMSTAQMTKYRVHHRRELGGDLDGALVLLVPETRLREAEGIMEHLRKDVETQVEGAGRITPVALSWVRVLNVLADAAPDDPSPNSIAGDVVQLRAACEALSEWSVPLSSVPEVERQDFLGIVLDKLKDRLPANAFNRREVRDADYTVFRYWGLPGTEGTVMAIGLTSALGDNAVFWMRFHKETGNFAEVKKRLRRSLVAEQIREHRGHLWFALPADPDLPLPELIDSLAVQATVILNAAAPATEHPGEGRLLNPGGGTAMDAVYELLDPLASLEEGDTE